MSNPEVGNKLAALEQRMGELGSVLVCYSGGVDSAFVLAVAHRTLGGQAIGMTAVSPSLAPAEREGAIALARDLGVDLRLVDSHEMDDERYAANEPDRCFHCKRELFAIAERRRKEWGLNAVLTGANVDDLGDYRPGLKAGEEAGVVSPLIELGFTKQDVRDAARGLDLPVWDKPAAACLASRIPYGTAVTAERLDQVGRFEAAICALGFGQLRVRHHGSVARIEIDPSELTRAAEPATREALVAAGKEAGFQYVALDLGGYRMGSHNEVLPKRSLPVAR
ncbi:MAG: ATP-dependent sacrificial sulfur transferase LarE [Deltaproteobacteria bacterium]|nr:ATP-dependent sacrificial sulfur transferase LarE [Deltaproteobacteria bacterium]